MTQLKQAASVAQKVEYQVTVRMRTKLNVPLDMQKWSIVVPVGAAFPAVVSAQTLSIAEEALRLAQPPYRLVGRISGGGQTATYALTWSDAIPGYVHAASGVPVGAPFDHC